MAATTRKPGRLTMRAPFGLLTCDRKAIAQRAYQIWLEKGCPSNTAEQDWLQAEAELDMALDVAGKAGAIFSTVQEEGERHVDSKH